MLLYWISLICFLIFLLTSAISLSLLIKILQTRYSNFYKKDSKRGTFISPYYKKLWTELMYETPYWINQEFDAKLLLWIYRLSTTSWLAAFIVFFLSRFRLFE